MKRRRGKGRRRPKSGFRCPVNTCRRIVKILVLDPQDQDKPAEEQRHCCQKCAKKRGLEND